MDNKKRQIFEAFQNQLEGLTETEQAQVDLANLARESGVEQELVQDAQLDGTLRLQKHIESTDASFVDAVMELVEGGLPGQSGKIENFTLTESRITGNGLTEIESIDPAPKVDPIPKVAPIPKATPIPKVTPVPKVVPSSACKPISPNSEVNQGDIPKVVPKVQPITPLSDAATDGPVFVQPIKQPVKNHSVEPEGKLAESPPTPPPHARDIKTGDIENNVMVPAGVELSNNTVGVTPSKRQYDRVNRKKKQVQFALAIALSIVVVSAIGFVIASNSSNGDGSSLVDGKNADGKNGDGKNKKEDSGLVDTKEKLRKKLDLKNQKNHIANGDLDNPFKVADEVDNTEQFVNRNNATNESKDRAKERLLPELPERPEEETYARLVESSDAVWSSGSSGLDNDKPMKLRNGKVVFRMGNGALVTVVGPSQFQIKSADRVELNSGKLSANVPPRAVGFTVFTPASKVVDLGTEFDVSVNELGATGVRVRKGEVTLEPLVDTGTSKEKWSLREGDFKWIDEKGTSHDWNMTLKLDGRGQGAVHINGMTFQLSDKSSFDEAKARIQDEFQKFEQAFMTRVGNSKSFSGVIDMAGKKMNFDDIKEFKDARLNASESLKGLEDIMNKFDSDEILKRGIRSSSGSFSIGASSMSKDGVEMGVGKATKDGIQFNGFKFPGVDGGMFPKGFRIDRNGMGIGQRLDGENKIKPGPNELILLVNGAGGGFRLRTTDGEAVSDVRQLKGGREETEIPVSKDQKITLYMDGAGNVVAIPTSLRRNIKTTIQGAGNKVEYFTERTRFREKLRKERESGRRSKPPAKKLSETGKPDSRLIDSKKIGPLLIVVSGSSNKIELEVTEDNAQSGIRVVHGIKENATIHVGAKQHVTVYLDGIRNEAIAPVEIKMNVTGRLDGIENRLLFRTADGKIVGGFEMQSRDQQNQYESTRKVRSGYVGARPSNDRSTLLVLIEGENHDIIFREAKRRGDYGAKFIEGKTNEISFNVLPEQRVYVLNKARESIVFIDEGLRESVSVESKGSKNAVDYFE